MSLVSAPGSPLPKTGQLVTVRSRPWVVAEVAASRLDPDPLATGGDRSDHIVTLTSIEEEGFGEALSVVWEVEPGARIVEEALLPDPADGYDSPRELDAFLDAVRWGAVTSADADALQAPFRSGIELDDYQLSPLIRALAMPRANLLIADDVGLGKTIEAGLIIQELILRHRARTVLILCPPTLCEKWQEEMEEKFGLEFRILNAEEVRGLRRDRGVGLNPLKSFPRLIASIDWLKLAPQMRLVDDVLPADSRQYPRAFDLLVVDEAHSCAPAATAKSKYAVDSLRTRAVMRLVDHFEHRLFLTATPHNGYQESFQGLLELIDPQRFARGIEPKPGVLGETMIRRLKSELRAELPPNPDGSHQFPKRTILTIPVEYSTDELTAYDDLNEYSEGALRSAGGQASRSAARLTALLLKKRLVSSPAAFAATLDAHVAALDRAEQSPYTEADVEDRFGVLHSDETGDLTFEDAEGEALAVAAGTLGEPGGDQTRLLGRLRAYASANRNRPDSKSRALLELLDNTCRPDGTWNAERVIVFTEYRATQDWLKSILNAGGYGAGRLGLIYGGMDPTERSDLLKQFQYDPAVTQLRVLLATDSASEGIDLQKFCNRVIHYEIPFSPTRLEQRNGRVDRRGQRHPEVLVYHFTGRNPDQGIAAADADFLFRIAEKVSEIRDDLGSANPVIEAQIEEAMLGHRHHIDDESIDRAKGRAAERLKAVERRFRSEVAKAREQLDKSITDLHVTPLAVERVVMTALALGGQPELIPTTDPVTGKTVWCVPTNLDEGWARTVSGLWDPIGKIQKPVTFDAEVARGRDDVVHLHLGHPLVARAARLLRARLWSTAGTGNLKLQRVTCRLADVQHPTVVVHARVVVSGTKGHRLHEEVVSAAGTWRDRRLERLGVRETEAVLAAADHEPAPKHVADMLADQWPSMRPRVETMLAARAREVARQIAGRLDSRCDAEVANIRAVLSELQKAIEKELVKLERGQNAIQQQLPGMEDRERRQAERDWDALRRRVAEIPAEADMEADEIRRRYVTRDPDHFPVAVELLVPRHLTGRIAQ